MRELLHYFACSPHITTQIPLVHSFTRSLYFQKLVEMSGKEKKTTGRKRGREGGGGGSVKAKRAVTKKVLK